MATKQQLLLKNKIVVKKGKITSNAIPVNNRN